ncbi:hypothetical protein [Oceanobacillus kapialis]|uniref:hypothetical protein n=1 Tax=Oceanobacillus kapialis TaxID=481353 RepID=UPI00384F3090
MQKKLKMMSFAVMFFGIMLLLNLLGYTIIPNAISIVAIFVLSTVLAGMGTVYQRSISK